MNKAVNKFKLVLAIGMISLPVLLHAQGPGLPGGGDDVNDSDVPFDGGVSLLVAAGIAYGLKKANYNKSQKKLQKDFK